MAAEELRGDSLKQRLVGGVALLVIGVVAWFWLLSADSPVDPVSRTTQIPTAPDIKPFDVPEPAPPADIAPIGSEREAPPALRAPIANEGVAAAKPVSAPTPAQGSPTVAVAKPAAEKKSVAEKSPSAKPRETFELSQQGLPVAWVVQVGLFSNQASADKIKAQLQAKGFKAYTEPYKTASAPAGVKVFVGPKLSRERADEQKRAIDAALKVNSMVVRFQSPQR